MADAFNRTIYLVRHGQTEWNAERRMQGQWDSRLSEAGRRHADVSGQFLAKCGIDAIYASPIGRVQDTAAIIRPHLGLDHQNDDRLMEWSSGDWSGFLYSEIQERWPTEFAAWQADMLNVRAPNGENFLDLMARASSFVDELQNLPGANIAILAHGFINRALACVLLERPAAATLTIRQANDVIIRIRLGPSARDAAHFIAGEGPHADLPREAGAVVA